MQVSKSIEKCRGFANQFALALHVANVKIRRTKMLTQHFFPELTIEGSSDREFWKKVLRKHFSPTDFDIRNMKSKSKLIRETPALLNTFRDLHYGAGFILVNRDKQPCPTAV